MAHRFLPGHTGPSGSANTSKAGDSLGQTDELTKPAGLENIAPSPPFGVFARLLDKIEEEGRKAPGHKTKGGKPLIVREFFEVYREKIGFDLYPVVRLLLPERDTKRKQYRIKEANLAKAYQKVMELAPSGEDALRMKNWNKPTADNPTAGDFAMVLFSVIQKRSTVTEGKMSIEDVNHWLDRLAYANNNKARGTPGDMRAPKGLANEQARLLGECWVGMTANEQKWLIRIILRDLKIGIGENSILPQVHRDASAVFNTCSDLQRVCWTLADPQTEVRREDMSVAVGHPFRPMLSLRNQRDLKDIVKAMHNNGRTPSNNTPEEDARRSEQDAHFFTAKEFIIEEKLDGERIQLHMSVHLKTRARQFAYFSRKAIEYTYLYGANAFSGSLTPRIAHLIRPEIEEVILDGEMVAFDPSLGKVVPFGNLKTFALMNAFGPTDPRPMFKVFDILHIKTATGSQTLLKTPLKERRQLLATNVFSPPAGQSNVLECALSTKAFTVQCIRTFLTKVLEERGEGLIVKNPDSRYILGGRQNTWIKVKPDYMDELGESIECLVLGGYWGSGPRTAGKMSSFLVGLRTDESLDPVEGEEVMATFAKVGSGLSMWVYDRIVREHAHKFFDFDRRRPPAWLKTSHSVSRELPDQLIKPSESFVLMVKAAEVIPGIEFGAGLTLRFPRSKWLEENKTIEDVFSVGDVVQLRGQDKRKLVGNAFIKKTKRRTTVQQKASAVSSSVGVALPSDLGDLEVPPTLFEGLTFFVNKLAPPALSKEEVQVLIERAGGEYIQRIPDPSPERRVIASGIAGAELMKKGAKQADILHADWVVDCIKQGRIVPRTERYYLQVVEDGTKQGTEYSLDDRMASQLRHAIDDDDNGEREGSQGEGWEDLKMESDDEDVKPSEGALKRESARYDTKFHSVADDRFANTRTHAETSEDEEEPETDPSEPPTDDENGAEIEGQDEESDFEIVDLPVASGQSTSSLVGAMGRLPIRSPTKPKVGSTAVQDVVKREPSSSPTASRTDPMEPEVDESEGRRAWGPIVCYFDTEQNAAKNALQLTAEPNKAHDKKLAQAEKQLLASGGNSTATLLDPALTHIIAHPAQRTRFTQLVQLTREPRSRKLVGLTWVLDCVGNMEVGGGLVEEDGYRL